jgi:hypothetical protein
MAEAVLHGTEVVHGLDEDTAARSWELYVGAFTPLASLAAHPHLLDRAAFSALVRDPRVESHLIRDDDGVLLAQASLTAELALIPWLSPAFYEQRWPEAAAEGRLHFIAFLFVAPRLQRHGLLADLTRSVVGALVDRRAVLGFDVCEFNDAQFSLTRLMQDEASRMGADHDLAVADVQRFYAVTFDGTPAISARACSTGSGRA